MVATPSPAERGRAGEGVYNSKPNRHFAHGASSEMLARMHRTLRVSPFALLALLALTACDDAPVGPDGSTMDAGGRDAATFDAATFDARISDAEAPDAQTPDAGSDAGPACPDLALRRTFGMNIDPANPGGNPTAAELRAAGVRWVRVEYKQPRGVAPHRDVIDAMHAEGIRVLLIVDYSSVPGKPASNAGDAEWSSYLDAYRVGVEGIADALGDRVDAWQIWNEPDLFNPGTGYDPGVPAAHFGRMLSEASTAIRARSSGLVITAGLASGDASYLGRASDAIGGELPVDAVAVHPYGQRAPDGWPDPSWGFGDMSDLFDRYLAYGRPLWVSEIGTVDAGRLAEYVTNVYTLATGEYAGRVEVVLWFCWADAMVAPFGLHAGDGTPKAAYDAYAALTPPFDATCEPAITP